MYSKKIRRIPAVFVAAALLFATVFSCAYTANAYEDKTFTPRFTEPSYDNSDDMQYYYSNANIFQKYGYGMPNCTAYAWGRAYEITGERPSLCVYDASEWYDYTEDGYERGQTPKLGAIACWTYERYGETGGHVAVVESIDNGVITFSNSAWGWLNFYLETADVDDENAGQSDWDFQGYIYIGDFDDDSNQESADNYNLGTYKVSVDDYLNVRKSPSTSSDIVGEFSDGEIINVTDISVKYDRVWAYATNGSTEGWVALDYCKYVGEYDDSQSQPDNEYLSGDINLDGYVDITDTTVIQLYLANALTLNDAQKVLADINGNGSVDVSDVTIHQIQLTKNR